MKYTDVDGVKVARFENVNGQDVIQINTPDGNHWYYIDGEWILHN